MYFNLIKKLANIDRNHNSRETWKAFNLLNKFYKGSKLLKFTKPKQINKWEMIPFWDCKKAELRNSKNELIVSKKKNNLSVYSFAPKINKEVDFKTLKKHILTDSKRPSATIFHFRNQYRHWNPEWGFSLPYNLFKKLDKKETYKINIESNFKKNKGFLQSEYLKKGRKKETYILIGHFDHPNQVNDGLAGVIAAYETIKRLKKIKTKYSYLAFASIEMIGSMYYLNKLKKKIKKIKEGLFLTFCGINSNIVYQKSFFENSLVDKIVENCFLPKKKNKSLYKHRQLIGNDENIFDSVGFNIPTGTLLRWPFKEYHTDLDNIKITKKEKIEEMISLNLKIINIIEKNNKYKALYKGVPCLSSNKIKLYLDPTKMSKKKNKVDSKLIKIITSNLTLDEKKYVSKNHSLLYGLMNNSVRMADGNFSVLDVARKSKLPFFLVLNYLNELKKKNLVRFLDEN